MLKARNRQVLNSNGVITRCAIWKLYLDLANKLSSHKFTFRSLLFTSASMSEPPGAPATAAWVGAPAVAMRSDVGVRADSCGRHCHRLLPQRSWHRYASSGDTADSSVMSTWSATLMRH